MAGGGRDVAGSTVQVAEGTRQVQGRRRVCRDGWGRMESVPVAIGQWKKAFMWLAGAGGGYRSEV